MNMICVQNWPHGLTQFKIQDLKHDIMSGTNPMSFFPAQKVENKNSVPPIRQSASYGSNICFFQTPISAKKKYKLPVNT